MTNQLLIPILGLQIATFCALTVPQWQALRKERAFQRNLAKWTPALLAGLDAQHDDHTAIVGVHEGTSVHPLKDGRPSNGHHDGITHGRNGVADVDCSQ